MKNMKKLLQKAMVFTLSAAMLVGTPMTASAAGLVDLYSIDDGSGNVKPGNNSPIGTVTNTDTNTGFLIGENVAKIVGIALDRTTVNAEVDTPETLKATVILDGEIKVDRYNEDGELEKNVDITEYVVKALSKKIKWQVLYPNKDDTRLGNPAEKVALVGAASDRSEITLDPKQGTAPYEKVTVRASIDASYYFKASNQDVAVGSSPETSDWGDKYIFTDGDRIGACYTADATVSVKEYATGLSWKTQQSEDEADELNVKKTLDLSDELLRVPLASNDEITWVSSAPSLATVSAQGVVTAKKKGLVTITAVSEHGAKAERRINVTDGRKADVVKLYYGKDEEGNDLVAPKNTSYTLNNDTDTVSVTVKMFAKVKSKGEDGKVTTVEVANGDSYIDDKGVEQTVNITDEITWSSNKLAVAIVEGDKTGATVTLKGAGKATITAKATNGKSATTTFNVTAPLTELSFVGNPNEAISGQTINMAEYVVRNPAGNTDALKWSVKDAEGNTTKNATISQKGVLKIANKVNVESGLKVYVEPKKAITKEDGTSVQAFATISLTQSTADVIQVYDYNGGLVAQGGFDASGKKLAKKKTELEPISLTSEINVPLKKTYTAEVLMAMANEGEDGKHLSDGDASSLTWKSNNAKVASIDGTGDKVTIKAEGAGTATITVSGIRDDGKNAKALSVKFKVKVKQPVTTLTMNKSSITLAEKTKKNAIQDQKVSLKVTFGPKKYEKSQAKIASWTVQQISGKRDKEYYYYKEITDGKANCTITLDKPEAGDVYKITAKSVTGATATSTVTVVTPTVGVAIKWLDEDGKLQDYDKKGVELKIGGESLELQSYINTNTKKDPVWKAAGDEDTHVEDVTYSVNRKGIVTIDKDGVVHAIKTGNVTITAKTPTGKKATLKVKVTN